MTSVMPDVEAALIGWLSARTELVGVTVSSVVPTIFDDGHTFNGSQKVVRICRLGGGMDNSLPFYLDRARLDVDAFGPTKADAHDLSAVVRKLILHDLRTADLSTFNAVIRDTTEYVGPQYFDEPDYPPAGRYLMQVGLTVHPFI